MSKYDPLWKDTARWEGSSRKLTFEQIEAIAGVPLDHSFLNFKKELAAYGWQVGKISMKEQTVVFTRL